MKRLVKWLRRVMRPSTSPLLAVSIAPEWTAEDATKWNQFLGTPAGQTLWMRARARQAALCIEACEGKHSPQLAAGFTFTLNWLEQLANAESISGSEPVKSETTDASIEDAGLSLETSTI